MRLEDVADHLGVNERYVRRLIAERRVPYLKIGHLIRFDPTDIETWIEESRVLEAQLGRRRRGNSPMADVAAVKRRPGAEK